MLWLGILALLAAGCAGMPPEQHAREAAMWEVAQRCQARFGSVASIDQIDGHGRLRYTCHGSCPEREAFGACYAAGVQEVLQSGVVSASGHLSTASRAVRRTEVPVTLSDNRILVPVTLNGSQTVTLLLDTGASASLLDPAVARRPGLAPGTRAPSMSAELVGGRRITIPVARLRSLRVGELAVEELDVGIYEAAPGRPDVQGLLGGDFLRNFRVTVDPAAKRLILEVP
ncbi:MAG: retropepsin-like domain-containing protein [Candidatus Rokubacteria bacterium]|nr:retropepsin-like domain-containing protein [Candidatus Rokubacteria bacterium]MBI3105870.1 retropepsin-like domain-containing protein [Candidatus Rokubacteria bacterium]